MGPTLVSNYIIMYPRTHRHYKSTSSGLTEAAHTALAPLSVILALGLFPRPGVDSRRHLDALRSEIVVGDLCYSLSRVVAQRLNTLILDHSIS